MAPRAGDAAHVGLTAELALCADLGREPRDLVGERAELVDHGVDGALQLEELALGVDQDLAREIALRDGGRHRGDVANLVRQVRRHQVHVVRQLLPDPANAGDVGLTAEAPFHAHLARYARHLRREGVQLIDHRVQDRLELENFPASAHRDLLR